MAFDEHVEETGAPNFKTNKWCCICWVENMRLDWRECVEELLDCPGFYAEHDKDKDSQGKPRKQHIHLSMFWNGPINRAAAKKIANRLSEPGKVCCSTAQPIARVRNNYEYAIHNTEKAQKDGKYLYPEGNRVTFGGFEIGFYEQLSTEERDRMCYEISKVIGERKIGNLEDLRQVIDREYDFRYFQVFKSQNGFFDRLCRGVYLKKKERRERGSLDKEAFEPGRVALSEAPVHDSLGNRILVCQECGKVGYEEDFTVYGGESGVNIGICRDCFTAE